jgi:hypothetical protein
MRQCCLFHDSSFSYGKTGRAVNSDRRSGTSAGAALPINLTDEIPSEVAVWSESATKKYDDTLTGSEVKFLG